MSVVRWFLRNIMKGVRLLTEHTKVSISHLVEWTSGQSREMSEATTLHQRRNAKREDNEHLRIIASRLLLHHSGHQHRTRMDYD